MRVAKIKIDDKSYYVACPIGTLQKIENYNKNESKGEEFVDAITILHFLLEAGEDYAKNQGIDNPKLPTVKGMLQSLDISDFLEIQKEVEETIKKSMEREVEIDEKEQQAKQEAI